jgi:hypothetical protein
MSFDGSSTPGGSSSATGVLSFGISWRAKASASSSAVNTRVNEPSSNMVSAFAPSPNG